MIGPALMRMLVTSTKREASAGRRTGCIVRKRIDASPAADAMLHILRDNPSQLAAVAQE